MKWSFSHAISTPIEKFEKEMYVAIFYSNMNFGPITMVYWFFDFRMTQ